MRLIDADVLIEAIKNMSQRYCDCKDCDGSVKIIRVSEVIDIAKNEVPTAYDVDKVVMELEEMKTIKGSMKTVTCRKWDYGTVNRAIEIVKSGGVSDDCCEWKQTSTAKYKTSCGYRLEEYFDTKACYCKQCGKKIKIVGD